VHDISCIMDEKFTREVFEAYLLEPLDITWRISHFLLLFGSYGVYGFAFACPVRVREIVKFIHVGIFL
jgi:hypothetical protein